MQMRVNLSTPLIRAIPNASTDGPLNSSTPTEWRRGSFVSRQALRSCFAWRRDASISSAGVFRAVRILRTEPDISRGEKASMANKRSALANCSSKQVWSLERPKMRLHGFQRPDCRQIPTLSCLKMPHASFFWRTRSRVSLSSMRTTLETSFSELFKRRGAR